jgi:hypothetical protein
MGKTHHACLNFSRSRIRFTNPLIATWFLGFLCFVVIESISVCLANRNVRGSSRAQVVERKLVVFTAHRVLSYLASLRHNTAMFASSDTAHIAIIPLLRQSVGHTSMWQTRRVVLSKDTIYFARIGESTFFDSIPLAEVRGIDKVDEAPVVGSTALSARQKKARTVTTGA